MRNIFSVILSIFILVASMGFTVSSHICGGKRVKTEFGLVSIDVSCGMEKEENNCAKGTQMKSNCCQNHFNLIQMNEDYTQQLAKVNFSQDFNIVFIAVLFDFLPNITKQTIFFKDYSPPPLVRNIPVLVQSFLI